MPICGKLWTTMSRRRMKMREASNKVALVFGGARGIGAAAVARLAQDGFAVAFTYVSRDDKAQALVTAVAAGGGQALAIKADSSDVDQIRDAVAQTVATFGKINTVVVNAGIFTMGTIDVATVAQLDQILNINVRGVFLAIQAAAAQMTDGGRVITIGSNVVHRTGTPGASMYQFSKAAVASMVKGLALDLAPRRITVNNVQPGPTNTDINAAYLEALAEKSPLKRVAEPSEIAGLISYMASADAGYMTGASVTIDGGYTL
ncbi:SDR family oxidoreductase [Sphingomonas sp. ASY06-1R]|uniref:SDR family oxidoreductase n=1 Tax=Sphingomonas sp. ASY06-1R TaxID=3445771 RepID=UPI003FA2F037